MHKSYNIHRSSKCDLSIVQIFFSPQSSSLRLYVAIFALLSERPRYLPKFSEGHARDDYCYCLPCLEVEFPDSVPR